jgi:23S rRNA pseudouridine1911/1915/1917 synthase
MKIKILYEDKDILAVEKPSGILVHPDEKTKEKTIYDIFIKKYPKLEIVHRLDKETSGVLLLAKNKKAHEFLKAQFQNREVKKVYNAIVNGHPRSDRGVINKPIGRSPSDFRRRLAGRGARGEMRDSITEYRVLNRFNEGKNKFSFLEVRPKTGRTHQIRVHMKFINSPVVCDPLYNEKNPNPKGLKRLGLHARSIEFKNLKGETVKLESTLPKELKKFLK